MIVIKDEGGGNLQVIEKILKISLGECWDILEIFRSEEREGFTKSRRSPLCGLSQVKEKGRRVCITGVYLVPKARNFTGLEIACNESCFPTSGWPRDPDHRLFSHAIQEAK